MQESKTTGEVNNNDPLSSLSTSRECGGEEGDVATIHPATTLTVYPPTLTTAASPSKSATEADGDSLSNSENNGEQQSAITATQNEPRDDPPKLMEVKLEPASPPDSPPPPAISPAVDVVTYEEQGTPSPSAVGRRSPDEKFFQPINQTFGENLGFYEYDSNDRLEVECGNNKALLIIDKLCQGSKGKCIEFMGNMLTPNEFQSVSGRETAKDWKRSIRYRGKSLKTLMARGLLKAHPLLCECHRCKSALHNKKKLESSSSPESKRRIIDMSIDNNYVTQYSSAQGGPDAKRSRSVSPMDIYDVEQRRLFEMANSPEPKNIETFQRSLKNDDSLSTRDGSSDEKSPSNDGNPNETVPSTTAQTEVLKDLHYTSITKPLGKHRKQTAPKQAVPHIALTAIPTIKTHTAMRPRLHQVSHSLTISPGPTSEGSVIKRAKSLYTPTSKSSSHHVRMIELTRPAQSSTDRRTPPTALSNGDDGSYRQSASSTSDTVFLPSEMLNWSVDDVAEFVQSLKGCEEYSQVFREQAIDGEILPVLTEEHLLNNMGLKLGPALKIKIHVAKRLGYTILDETLQ